MKVIDIHQVDAFTDELFGGNPAGVVTNADPLTNEEMQKIAREMNLSETAFVVRPSSDRADVKLRFFTPTDEVAFCGHATIGTLFQLARLRMFGLGDQVFDFARIRENFGKERIVVFCLFSEQTVSGASGLHARGLAPNVGVDEDAFTGSMQAGLVHAAKQNEYINANKRHIVTEQGTWIGRPGFAELHHDTATDEVVLTATAVQVFSTKMELNV